MALTVGVDVGGTKVLAGLVTLDGKVVARARRSSHTPDARSLVDVIADLVTELGAHPEAAGGVDGVGLSVAGFVTEDRSRVVFSANVPQLRGEPLRTMLGDRLGVPVVVENDANAAAWAEYRFGEGRDVEHLLLATVGTGIGGGVVIDGRLLRGGHGRASEFGHMPVVIDGRPCPCGGHGCWERYASGSALVGFYRERVPGSTASGPDITALARDGDPVAVAAFDEVGRWLGEGLAALTVAFDPERIVLGGGVSEAGHLLLEPATVAYRHALTGSWSDVRPDVVLATSGEAAGLVGAADLARR